MVQVRSRYRNTCPTCSGVIEVGDLIRPSVGGKWHHAHCTEEPSSWRSTRAAVLDDPPATTSAFGWDDERYDRAFEALFNPGERQ